MRSNREKLLTKELAPQVIDVTTAFIKYLVWSLQLFIVVYYVTILLCHDGMHRPLRGEDSREARLNFFYATYFKWTLLFRRVSDLWKASVIWIRLVSLFFDVFYTTFNERPSPSLAESGLHGSYAAA